MHSVEPFDDFLARVRVARRDQFSGAACSEPEFERMKAYILHLNQDVHVARSFADSSGRPIDCIPFDELPTVRAARARGHQVQVNPPPLPRAEGQAAAPTRPSSLGPCPEGAVAWPRLTLEDLVSHPTLEDYFAKTSAFRSWPRTHLGS
jgi:hypothetical protein